MKSLFAVASIVAFSFAPAYAAEGHVSKQSLENMGLAGMKAMTDVQGMNIRGLSIAVVSGGSNAKLLGAGAGSTFYAKGDGNGTHYAEGNSASTASDNLTVTQGYKTTSITFTASSATQAFAKAH